MTMAAPMIGARQVVEKYFNMRVTKHTAVHQADLAAFAQRHGPSLGVAGVEEEYYRQFRERVTLDVARYEAAKQAILDDPGFNGPEKRKAIDKLDPPLQPAWGPNAEAAFLHSYGDPRVASANYLAEISDRSQDVKLNYDPMNGQDVWEPRTPWELHVMREMVTPRDGSIPVTLQLDASRMGTPAGNYTPGWRREVHPEIGRSSMASDWGGATAPPQPPPVMAQQPQPQGFAVGPPPAPLSPRVEPGYDSPAPRMETLYDDPPGSDVVLARTGPSIVVPKAEPANAILDANGNPLVVLSEDSATRKAQLKAYDDAVKAANSICRYCQSPKPRGLKNHEVACARRHGAEYSERAA